MNFPNSCRMIFERAVLRRPIPTRRRLVEMAAAVSAMLITNFEAYGRDLTSQVTELNHIPSMRAEFPVPNDPGVLFYIQRSVNSNTVVYAHVDLHGRFDPEAPVDVYWRWYNVDGRRKPLNLIERTMAYGVRSVGELASSGTVTFQVAALPERALLLEAVTDDVGYCGSRRCGRLHLRPTQATCPLGFWLIDNRFT